MNINSAWEPSCCTGNGIKPIRFHLLPLEAGIVNFIIPKEFFNSFNQECLPFRYNGFYTDIYFKDINNQIINTKWDNASSNDISIQFNSPLENIILGKYYSYDIDINGQLFINTKRLDDYLISKYGNNYPSKEVRIEIYLIFECWNSTPKNILLAWAKDNIHLCCPFEIPKILSKNTSFHPLLSTNVPEEYQYKAYLLEAGTDKYLQPRIQGSFEIKKLPSKSCTSIEKAEYYFTYTFEEKIASGTPRIGTYKTPSISLDIIDINNRNNNNQEYNISVFYDEFHSNIMYNASTNTNKFLGNTIYDKITVSLTLVYKCIGEDDVYIGEIDPLTFIGNIHNEHEYKCCEYKDVDCVNGLEVFNRNYDGTRKFNPPFTDINAPEHLLIPRIPEYKIGTSDFTFEFWMNIDIPIIKENTLIMRWEAKSNINESTTGNIDPETSVALFRIPDPNNNDRQILEFRFDKLWNTRTSTVVRSSFPVLNNILYHIVLQKKGVNANDYRIYINGVNTTIPIQSTLISGTDNLDHADGDLAFGIDWGPNNINQTNQVIFPNYQGHFIIANLRFYNRILPPLEVLENYENGVISNPSNMNNLLMWYKLNQKNGDKAISELTGNLNNPGLLKNYKPNRIN